MMLPSAIPAVLRRTRASGHLLAAPVLAASCIAMWAVVGIAVYALYRPHGSVAAGVVVIVVGVYELTPIKRHCRLQCRESPRSGLVFGLDCVGSSIGVMAMLVVVGGHERHLDGGHRRRHGRPEGPARQDHHRCSARAGDRRFRHRDPRGPLVNPRTSANPPSHSNDVR